MFKSLALLKSNQTVLSKLRSQSEREELKHQQYSQSHEYQAEAGENHSW
jgi:hypothetical protein